MEPCQRVCSQFRKNISAGTGVTRQIVEELFAYPSPLTIIEVKGVRVGGPEFVNH